MKKVRKDPPGLFWIDEHKESIIKPKWADEYLLIPEDEIFKIKHNPKNKQLQIPTHAQFWNFNGVHCDKTYSELPYDWYCPACLRYKYHILRIATTKSISGERYSFLAAGYHKHHDHGHWIGLYDEVGNARFEPQVICEQCNNADASAKRRLKLHNRFSFSPAEISKFVKPTNHGWHVFDYNIARSIYNDYVRSIK